MMKQAASYLVAALGILLAAFGARVAVQMFFSGGSSGPAGRPLAAAASYHNASLPMMVDSVTELMQVLGDDSRSLFIYNYRLMSADATEVDLGRVRRYIVEELRRGVTAQACTTPETQEMVSEGITLRYAYHTRSREYLNHFEITSADCR